MVTLSTILANITEKIDLSEKVYDTKYGKVRVSQIANSPLYRVDIPSLGIEVVTHDETLGDFVELSIRFYGTSPGANLAIEEIVDLIQEGVA
jgi:hypothetical protein